MCLEMHIGICNCKCFGNCNLKFEYSDAIENNEAFVIFEL